MLLLVHEIELRHLLAMTAIAEEGTFGRAAERLGYTQSTVSQQIAALERAVGGPVFDRPGGPRPVRLTPLGAVVLERGREVLERADQLSTAIDRFKAGDGRIDIATFPSVSNVILPAVVRRLRDEHPGSEIRLAEKDADDPRVGDIDVFFYDRRVGGLEHLKLLDDPYLVVASPGTFPDGPVRGKQLDGEPLIAWPSTGDQSRLPQVLAHSGARPKVVFRCAANETSLSMVRAGLGFTVLPWLALHGVDTWSDDRLSVHELRPVTTREIFVLWPAGRTRSPLADRTIQIAVEVARELTAQMAS